VRRHDGDEPPRFKGSTRLTVESDHIGSIGRRPGMRRTIVVLCVLVLGGCAARAPLAPVPEPSSRQMDFVATAYAVTGTTASGMQTKPGLVAADPRVLALGTRIRIAEAGPYSGVYTVADTGPKVKGRHIDIFLRDPAEAKRFGKKHVKVEVLEERAEAQPYSSASRAR
jgi:3D (Asp-Asp-Asp) domain-containing protein